MPRMSIRATYALDEQTDRRIRRLAATWRVSQAEVIRRSVKAATEQADETLTPAQVVAHYAKARPLRTREATGRAIRALRNLRHADDHHRSSVK